jgi:quinoprotein glucose dehydrogenase
LHGGAEWPGGGLDPQTNILYIPYNRIPWILRSYFSVENSGNQVIDEFLNKNQQLKSCVECHGVRLAGGWDGEYVGADYMPPLIGLTKKYKFGTFVNPDYFKWVHKYSKAQADNPINKLSVNDLRKIWTVFSDLDNKLTSENKININGFWQFLLVSHGQPASKPPWGGLVAIDLNQKKIVWNKPLGSTDTSSDTGDMNFGGVAIAGSDVMFATGTRDRMIRAYLKSSGTLVWSAKLPHAGSAPPLLYNHGGCNYILINATGGLFIGYDKGKEIVALSEDRCIR